MTSRKNQQAAREYMRTHPEVAYMEALRRTSGPKADPIDPISVMNQGASRMPFAGIPELAVGGGYTQPSRLFGEHSDLPRLITVVGCPGDGKTTLLRGWLEQYRNSPAFVLDGRDLVDGFAVGERVISKGIEPWPLLTVLRIDRDRPEAKFPAFFDLSAIPPGSLVILDMSFDLASDEAHMSDLRYRTDSHSKETVSQWVDFYEMLPKLVRKMGITVVISVNVPDSVPDYAPDFVPDYAQPGNVVNYLPERLRGGIVVETMRWRFSAPWGAYSVTRPGVESEPSFFFFDALDPAPEAREGLPLLK